MIFGTDVSRYQTPEQMGGYAFSILNVEDPTIQPKIEFGVAHGIRLDVYKWCYPGQSGQHLCDQTRRIVADVWPAGLRHPTMWLDYEQSGVTPNQVREWFAACDAAGVRSGWYCYLALLNQQGNIAPDRDLWLAYYPGRNDGSYDPSYSDAARRAGAKLHQYTSGGGLDRNVVLDEDWYHAQGDRDMTPEEVDAWLFGPTPYGSRFVNRLEEYLFGPTGFGLSRFEARFIEAMRKWEEQKARGGT